MFGFGGSELLILLILSLVSVAVIGALLLLIRWIIKELKK